MDNQQVLKFVLGNYPKQDKDFYNSLENINQDEMKNALKELKLLDFTQRDTFYWKLQVLIEQCVADNGASDDNEKLAEIVVGKWNQSYEQKISTGLILPFLSTLNLKYLNTRKALVAICDGDLPSYKTFNSKPRLLIDLLVRFLVSLNIKQKKLFLGAINEVPPLLIGDVSRMDINDALTRMGFRQGKWLNFGKMSAYRRTIHVKELVYAEGIRSILLEAIKGAESTESIIFLKERLTDVVMKSDNQNNSEEDFEVEKLFDATVSEINELLVNEPIADTKPLYNGEDAIDSDPKNSLVSSLENALSAVKDALTQATQLPDNKDTVTDYAIKKQLSIAEDEIKRLKLALEQEKEKVAKQEEKAFKKILQAIGGESSNYLLSDLYEESQGKIPNNPNISAGRLTNLFSSLSLAIGLEEYSNFHEIGDNFTIQKDDLIKNYRIDGPIDSQSDEIKVKLLKYGWSINSKVVVQPLVEEVKGEK